MTPIDPVKLKQIKDQLKILRRHQRIYKFKEAADDFNIWSSKAQESYDRIEAKYGIKVIEGRESSKKLTKTFKVPRV